MALIDNVQETQRCFHFSYFQQAIREANNPVLDMIASNVAKKLFESPNDNDSQKAENLRDAVIIPVLRAFGKIPQQHMHPDSMSYYAAEYMDIGSLADIQNFPYIRGLPVSEELAREVAVLGTAVEQHMRLAAMAPAQKTEANATSKAQFNVT